MIEDTKKEIIESAKILQDLSNEIDLSSLEKAGIKDEYIRIQKKLRDCTASNSTIEALNAMKEAVNMSKNA